MEYALDHEIFCNLMELQEHITGLKNNFAHSLIMMREIIKSETCRANAEATKPCQTALLKTRK